MIVSIGGFIQGIAHSGICLQSCLLLLQGRRGGSGPMGCMDARVGYHLAAARV